MLVTEALEVPVDDDDAVLLVSLELAVVLLVSLGLAVETLVSLSVTLDDPVVPVSIKPLLVVLLACMVLLGGVELEAVLLEVALLVTMAVAKVVLDMVPAVMLMLVIVAVVKVMVLVIVVVIEVVVRVMVAVVTVVVLVAVVNVVVLTVVAVVAVLLVSVVLVKVALTVVTVAVTILISGEFTSKDDSTKPTPRDWKIDCKDAVKFDVSLTIWLVSLNICSASTSGATISYPTSQRLETDRAEEDEAYTKSWPSPTP